MKPISNPNPDAGDALKFLLKVFELSRRNVVEPCQMLGLPERRLLIQKRLKSAELPLVEEWGFKDLTASEKESLLNALDLIEMNAEMFNRLVKGLGSRGRHVGLPLVDKSPNQTQLKVPVSKGIPR
ncbi:MAG: hypothetical protein ACO3AF_09915 [Flavobacteriales bacterium]